MGAGHAAVHTHLVEFAWGIVAEQCQVGRAADVKHRGEVGAVCAADDVQAAGRIDGEGGGVWAAAGDWVDGPRVRWTAAGDATAATTANTHTASATTATAATAAVYASAAAH